MLNFMFKPFQWFILSPVYCIAFIQYLLDKMLPSDFDDYTSKRFLFVKIVHGLVSAPWYVYTVSFWLGITIALLEYLGYITPDTAFREISSTLPGVLGAMVIAAISIAFVLLQLTAQVSQRSMHNYITYDTRIASFISSIIFSIIIFWTVIMFKDILPTPLPSIYLKMFGRFVEFSVLGFCFCCVIWTIEIVFYIASNSSINTVISKITMQTMKEIENAYQPYIEGHFKHIDTHADKVITQYKKQDKTFKYCKIMADESGYINNLYLTKLNIIFKKHPRWSIYICRQVGNFIEKDVSEIAIIYYDNADTIIEPTEDEIKTILTAIDIKPFRSIKNDIGFGIRQLTDIAVRSATQNDTGTCRNALDYLCSIIHHLAKRIERPTVSQGSIIYKQPTFKTFVDLAFDSLFLYGKHDFSILKQLIKEISGIIKDIDNPHSAFILMQEVDDFEVHRIVTDGFDSIKGDPNHLFFKTVQVQEHYITILNALIAYYKICLNNRKFDKQSDCPKATAYFKNYEERYNILLEKAKFIRAEMQAD
jgi:uncharacterized membrane protein